MKKTCLLIVLLLGSFISAFAQTPSWQWGKRGGSPVNMLGYGPSEDVSDITTDKWGNIYMATIVANWDLNIDGINFPCWGSESAAQACIVSFKCDGTLRWYKMVIGGTDDQAYAIKTDTLGGVYLTGSINVSAYFGSGGPDSGYVRTATVIDTVLTNTHYKTWFIMKLDTGGAYKWFRMPEPDTLTLSISLEQSAAIDMDVDENGNSHLLSVLAPGAVYANGAYVSKDTAGWRIWGDEGAYLLKYDRNGNFQNGFHLPFKFVGNGAPNVYMKRDYKRHRNYFTGNTGDTAGDSLFINGTWVAAMFLTCFDDDGNMLWLKQDVYTPGIAGSPYDRIALDNNGNIYVTGECQGGFNFNGSIFNGGNAFVVKLDTNGNNVWAANCINDDVSAGIGIAVANDTVAMWGMQSSDYVIWGHDTLGYSYYRPYLVRFNATTGAVIGLDTIDHDMGSMARPADGGGFIIGTTGTITADPYGNFYAGGNFQSQLYVAGDTLISYGGETDWFIAKFGTTNCSDVLVPALSAPQNTALAAPVKIYPNPATGQLYINNAEIGEAIKICNIMGQQVYTGTVSETTQMIPLQNIPPGTYIVQLTDTSGNRSNATIVKY